MDNREYEAIYEDGVFKPVGAVALPDKTKVVVRAAELVSDTDREAAKKRMFESLSRRYATGDPDLAARHNEHQP